MSNPLMDGVIEVGGTPDYLYEVVRLPFLCRVERAAYRHRRRWGRRLVNRPLRAILPLLRRMSAGSIGLIRFDGVLLPFRGANLQFNALYRDQYQRAPYEWEVLLLLDRLLDRDGMFYDVGANWGYFALHASRLCRVIAFEPMPGAFRDLEAAAESAGAAIDCRQLALSDCGGTITMNLPDGMREGLARVSPEGIEVKAATLDSLGLPPPSVVKIDVEGHEGAVLKGALETIAMHRPVVIFESWSDPTNLLAMVPFDILNGLGYCFFEPCTIADGCPIPVDGASAMGPLALVPFVPAQRFLLAGHSINVVACHREKVDDLRYRLASKQLHSSYRHGGSVGRTT